MEPYHFLSWADERCRLRECKRSTCKNDSEAHEMGVKEGFDPFITLSFMALPVIPEIRVTPRGIYLVNEDRMLVNPFLY